MSVHDFPLTLERISTIIQPAREWCAYASSCSSALFTLVSFVPFEDMLQIPHVYSLTHDSALNPWIRCLNSGEGYSGEGCSRDRI